MYPPPEKSPNKKKDLSTVSAGYKLANKYEVKKKLGEGGFGAAFLVSSLTTAVPVTYVAKAQKLTDDPRINQDLLARFTQESQALQQLGNAHGQIPSLFDFFEFEGNFYLIQEYIKGQNLLDVLIERLNNNQPFSEKEVIDLTSSILEVLTYVHESRIIHRDIKHQNIILREGDKKPVLIDFGIIKNAANYNPAETGTVIGTPGYCPLEQAAGHAMFQSDLYAVGVVALVLLTGINPGYIRPTDTFTHPTVLDDLEKEISLPLLEWFKESLAILPQNRFARAEEMREALLNLESKAASAPTVIRPKKGAKKEDYAPSSGVTLAPKPTGIITTQNEIDAFHAIRRIFQKAGLDPNRLQMKDTVEYCGINIDGEEKKTLIKLYFNDENNLSFSIVLANGKEEKFPINTMRGIAPKKDQIISRAKELMTGAKPKPAPANSLLDRAISELGFSQDNEPIINRQNENNSLSTSDKIYWHNIGFNDDQWWQYLKTNKIITANFKNEPGDEGEKILTSYRQGDIIIAYANGFGAIGWGIIKKYPTYRLIKAGSREDVRNGEHRHRLDIEWQAVAKKIEDGMSAGDILSKFGIHHPIKTSVRISDNEKGKLLIQQLGKKFK